MSKVFLATIHGKVTPSEFMPMRQAIRDHLKATGHYGGDTYSFGSVISWNRMGALQDFLASKADYLLFIDDDMAYPVEIGERLASHGQPVVGGLYFFRTLPNRGLPCWFHFRGDAWVSAVAEAYEGTRRMNDADEPVLDTSAALVPVDAIGGGCMCIRRDVFDGMERPFDYRGGVGEDLYFCHMARKAGHAIHGDPGVVCAHHEYLPIGVGTFRRRVEALREERHGLSLPQSV